MYCQLAYFEKEVNIHRGVSPLSKVISNETKITWKNKNKPLYILEFVAFEWFGNKQVLFCKEQC